MAELARIPDNITEFNLLCSYAPKLLFASDAYDTHHQPINFLHPSRAQERGESKNRREKKEEVKHHSTMGFTGKQEAKASKI